MILKTYDTILKDLCDSFDALISPKKISRSNANVIYLLLKAIAKGEEVINNTCVTLSHKFDPAYCSEEDLESVAKLVGTKKLIGSSTGLRVTVMNGSRETIILVPGTYKYEFNKDVVFTYENKVNTPILSGSTDSKFFSSVEIGIFPVTAQSNIKVTATDDNGDEIIIPPDLVFSCLDNKPLLGTTEETNVAFRERILTDTRRQGAISELELAIRNLPYVFDCNVVFNQTTSPLSYDDYLIPSYHMLITMSGDKRDEIAEIVANHGIYPTFKGAGATTLKYKNDIFASGEYAVYVHEYKKLNFKVQIKYEIDEKYTTLDKVKPLVESALLASNSNIHTDLISEATYYDIIESLHLVGFRLLCVNLQTKEGNPIDYIDVPKTRIAELKQEDIIWEDIVE